MFIPSRIQCLGLVNVGNDRKIILGSHFANHGLREPLTVTHIALLDDVVKSPFIERRTFSDVVRYWLFLQW